MTHGTRVMYVIGLCRCDECREANRIAQKDSEKRKREGRSFFVPAESVRERVRRLYALGMSENEVERAAGLDDKVLEALFRKHWRTGKPVTRIKRENAEAIMAVRSRAPLARSYIAAPDFPAMTLDLMALGYSGRWISERLGMSYQGLASLMRRSVTARTYAAMVKLHGSTAERAPESSQASRSRNYAQGVRGKCAPHSRSKRVAA